MFTGCTAVYNCKFNSGDDWVFWAMVLFLIKDSMMGFFAYLQNYPGILTSSFFMLL